MIPPLPGIGSMGQFLLMVSMSVAIIRFIRLVEGPFKDFGQNYWNSRQDRKNPSIFLESCSKRGKTPFMSLKTTSVIRWSDNYSIKWEKNVCLLGDEVHGYPELWCAHHWEFQKNPNWSQQWPSLKTIQPYNIVQIYIRINSCCTWKLYGQKKLWEIVGHKKRRTFRISLPNA